MQAQRDAEFARLRAATPLRVPAATTAAAQIVSYDVKVIGSNRVYVKYSWQVTLRNERQEGRSPALFNSWMTTTLWLIQLRSDRWFWTP